MRLSRPSVVAAGWACLALLQARRQLRTRPITSVQLLAPPALGHGGVGGVRRALRFRWVTCLERSLVLQAWEVAHGRSRDVVIGVTPPQSGFKAHAWLSDDVERGHDDFEELMRLAPRR